MMTKTEALEAMKEGKKIKHKYFSSYEWMKINKSGYVEFEDGCRASLYQFFSGRDGNEWNDGWSVVE